MILYINGNYPYHSLHCELVSRLADLGNEIIVFVPLSGTQCNGKYRCDHSKVTVYYCDCIDLPDRVLFLRKIRKGTKKIEEMVDLTKIDCILAGTVYSDGAMAYLLHKKFGIPFSVVVRYTDVFFQMRWRPYLNGFVKNLLGQASKIVFISPSYQSYLDRLEADHGKYVVIPNAVNDFWFLQSAKVRKKHEPISLIFVGEITKRKNVRTVIQAIHELKKRNVSVNFHVVGSGAEEKGCQALASKLGLKDQIFFHGWQNGKEKIREYYDQADIFVMLSFIETFGTVYVEALSQGLPMVYTRGQGIDGYFEQGTVGYSCDPRNIDEIVSAIVAIMENYESMSAACAAAARKFQWDIVAGQYDNVINEMRNQWV